MMDRTTCDRVAQLITGDGGSVSYAYPDNEWSATHYRISGLGRLSSLFLYNDGRCVLYKDAPWWSFSQRSEEIHLGPWYRLRYGDIKSCR